MDYFCHFVQLIISIHTKINIYFSSGPKLKEGQSRILPRNEAQDDLVVVVGLGKKDQSLGSQREGHDLAREAIRTSISSAVRSLKGMINKLLICIFLSER